MIRPKKRIGIVYSGKSIKYKEELKQIITRYQENGWCIQFEVVDDEDYEAERMIESRVADALNKFDYGMVFLTKDLCIQNELFKFVSKPNVLYELGYLRGHIDQNRTLCISDFPYREIVDNTYLMPSDIPGERIEEIDGKNYKSDLKKLFDKFIKGNNDIVKLENYNANDLISSLILNPNYKTNYEELFAENQLHSIGKYSLKWQLTEIFDLWQREKTKLNIAEEIMYLFERIVFQPFFPEEVIGNQLRSFLSVKVDKEDEYIFACYRILKSIGEYESYKSARNPYESAMYYLDKAKEIEEGLEIFGNHEIAPIIQCVAKNYIGLSLLNCYLVSRRKVNESKEYIEQLSKAGESFQEVIKISDENLGDSINVFRAFALYNLARVKRNLGENAETYYIKAKQHREDLSKTDKLPATFRLNFSLERIHAEIEYYDYLKEKKEIDENEYNIRISTLYQELDVIKQTPAAEVSLFKTLEDKLKKKMA